MKQRINLDNIYIIIFSSFFFLWGLDLESIKLFSFFNLDYQSYNFLANSKISYLVIFLIIPIFYNLIRNNFFSFKEIFNNQKNIIFFVLFIFAHFFIVKIYYQELINKSEIANLFYLLLLSIIYCHYRNFIKINFKKIIFFYLIIFVSVSIFKGVETYNVGQCNSDLFLIDILKKYLNISLTNSIYKENSHLAMMSIAVFFASIYILLQKEKENILFLFLFLIGTITVLNNLSTTYFVAYFFSQITLLFFFIKKINLKFWIISLIFLLINSYLFFSDKNCITKITDFEVNSVVKNNLEKKSVNLTTLIYQRSIIVSKKTLLSHSLGWGIDGMDNATNHLQVDYKSCKKELDDPLSWEDCKGDYSKHIYWPLFSMNIKDGLSNAFKMITEFGIFSFFIIFIFVRYLTNIKKISSYDLFIICLFITLCIRGAGYFNGGFIFCLLEFFFLQNKYKKLKKI